MNDEKNLLIVGGTGFIGRNLAQKALQEGYHVISLSSQKLVRLTSTKNMTYISVDIRDSNRLNAVLSDTAIHYVVNLGGYVDHSKFFSGGDAVIDTHLNGVINLARSLNWSHIKGFVQIGSSDEYGSNPAPQSESMRGRPFSSYSFAKRAAGHFLQMLYKEMNLPVSIIRLFLVYGPGQNHERFIPQIIQGCLNGEKFLASLGEQERDFCYIDDVIDGILKILQCPAAFGEVINLASGVPVRIKDMIELIRKNIGGGDPQYGMIPYREGENMVLYADISKAKEILLWAPATSLSQGIMKTIQYYQREKNDDCSFHFDELP